MERVWRRRTVVRTVRAVEVSLAELGVVLAAPGQPLLRIVDGVLFVRVEFVVRAFVDRHVSHIVPTFLSRIQEKCQVATLLRGGCEGYEVRRKWPSLHVFNIGKGCFTCCKARPVGPWIKNQPVTTLPASAGQLLRALNLKLIAHGGSQANPLARWHFGPWGLSSGLSFERG
jgi:hypothetical protein